MRDVATPTRKRGSRRKFFGRLCLRCGEVHASLSDLALEDRIGLLVERDGSNCGLCALPIIFYGDVGGSGTLGPSVDHILERRNGGCSRIENLRLTHCFCNGARNVSENVLEHRDWVARVRKPLEKILTRFDCVRKDGKPKRIYGSEDEAIRAGESLKADRPNGTGVAVYQCHAGHWHVMGLAKRVLRAEPAMARVHHEAEAARAAGAITSFAHLTRRAAR